MTSTDKMVCRMVAQALVAYGIKHVIVSPGSRNTPLIMAVNRCGELSVKAVVDERSAAFIALGMARTEGSPVALICTSGSAMLNYAPALAEAFYSRVPLVAVTADRPAAWIDQADSQTIRQPGALPTVVKGCFNIDSDNISPEGLWLTERTLNDALSLATFGPEGPVQINVAISRPLGAETEVPDDETFRKIHTVSIEGGLHNSQARAIAAELCNRRVLVVCGQANPSHRINRAMASLQSVPNVAVLAECVANVRAGGVIENFESSIPSSSAAGTFTPEILITFGGALVSARLKALLRSIPVTEHWHVGHAGHAVDTFQRLTRRFEMSPEEFFPKVANALAHFTITGNNHGTYKADWLQLTAAGRHRKPDLSQWSSPAAIGLILSRIPGCWNLQLSNGLSVREAMQWPTAHLHRVDCNRGVSGIDGCTSTALGASCAYPNPTMLITGDMSMQYDLGALTSTLISSKLKIVVINNSGGGIFSYVASSASLPERRDFLQCSLRLPLGQLAPAWGMRYIAARNFAELLTGIDTLINETNLPVIMEIFTDADTDSAALKKLQNI